MSTRDDPLVLTLNGVQQAYTMVGRDTASTQIVGISLVQTFVINTVLTVRNAIGSTLTITPRAGGPNDVSAHLVITRIR